MQDAEGIDIGEGAHLGASSADDEPKTAGFTFPAAQQDWHSADWFLVWLQLARNTK